MVPKCQNVGSKTHSGTFPAQIKGDHVSRPRSVALQAAGLERDNGRVSAKAAGLERAELQAGGFCAKSVVVVLQAGGLKRDTSRPRDTVPCCLRRKWARMGFRFNVLKL